MKNQKNEPTIFDAIVNDTPRGSMDRIPHLVEFQKNGLIDISLLNNSYEVHSFIEDRMAGITVTETIWTGATINSSHLSRYLANESTRTEVMKFFGSRALASILPMLVGPGSTWRVGGYRAGLNNVVKALSTKLGIDATSVVLEIIAPALVRNHVIVDPSTQFPVVQRFTYPFTRTAKLAALGAEAARMDMERSILDCSRTWSLVKGETYSVAAAAEEFASAYFPIARALRSFYDYSVILNDMKKVVRARLDPEALGLLGDIPKSILEHPVVDSLVTNYTFIEAALTIGNDDSEERTITPENTEFGFDKWATAVMALLKSSDRFAFRSRSDALQNYGLKHLDDLRGYRRASIFYEKAEMEAVALSVVAIPDDTLAGAQNIDKSTGRIDHHLAAAYGSLGHTMSVEEAVPVLSDTVQHLLELAEQPTNLGVFVHTVRDFDLRHVAMMLASKILYNPSSPSEVTYFVYTKGRLELDSGVETKGFVYTTDPAEVLLASEDLVTPSKAEALPQLLPRMALESHLYSTADDDVFIKSGTRFAFHQTVGSATITGSIRLVELEAARADFDASLVHPVYNDQVFRTARSVYESAYALIEMVQTDDSVRRRLKRQYAQGVIMASRGVAPAFRANMHRALVQKSLRKVEQQDVRIASAQLNRESVHAFTNFWASAFFLAVQGIGVSYNAESTEGIKVIDEKVARRGSIIDAFFAIMWTDTELAEALVEFGASDLKRTE